MRAWTGWRPAGVELMRGEAWQLGVDWSSSSSAVPTACVTSLDSELEFSTCGRVGWPCGGGTAGWWGERRHGDGRVVG